MFKFLFYFSLGSDKQHLDSSSDSEMDTKMMHSSSRNHSQQPTNSTQQSNNNNNNNSNNNNNNNNSLNTQSTHSMQINLSSSNSGGSNTSHHQSSGAHDVHHNISSFPPSLTISNITHSHGSSSSSSSNAAVICGSVASAQHKNLPQMPPLSAVTYSHLHSVMGSMPIYDIGDYQHL